MRAVHTRADPHPIHSDPWGDRIVPGAVWAKIYQTARSRNPTLPEDVDEATLRPLVGSGLRASPAYPNVILRSRYAEDALDRAASRGVRQYVLIGAGFDSYALRKPPSGGMLVIEIDHPATQSLKRQYLAQAGVALPDSAHLVAADLAVEDLASVLRRSPLRASEPAFFSWLGVTMYLTREANFKTLRAISSTAGPGSELVFEYVDQAFFESGAALSASERALLQGAAALGEPWLCGFSPSALRNDLALAGYSLLEDLPDTDLVRRYDPQGLNKLISRGLGRIALARVVGTGDA